MLNTAGKGGEIRCFELNLQPGSSASPHLRRVSREPVHVSLDPAALAGIHASAAVVTQGDRAKPRVVYGINTGFGLLANTRIPVEQLDELQRSSCSPMPQGLATYMDDPYRAADDGAQGQLLARSFLRHPPDGAGDPDDPHQRRSLSCGAEGAPSAPPAIWRP